MCQPPVRRHTMQGLLALLLAAWRACWDLRPGRRTWNCPPCAPVAAKARWTLEFAVRLSLPRAVEDALHRGVPVYFVAEAQLLRSRWYWRDERVARVQRTWRVAYQPLTGTWRVGLGGLNQNHATLAEALAVGIAQRGLEAGRPSQIDPDKSYYLEFSYRLDSAQLPGPMQFGLGGQGEWAVGGSRVIKVEVGP
jgi:hypothetical protein